MGRWEALSRVVEARAVEHACFGQPSSHSRRAFKKVKQFQAIVAADLTHAQRREAMRRVCARELQAARKAYATLRMREGDGFVEAFEDAIDEGGEGGVYVRLFEILKMATGKGKKIKWRGQQQESKTRFQGRRVPPVRLSSLYKDGDKDKEVVTGAKAVLEEVRQQAAAINGPKQAFPEVTRALMTQLRAFPAQPQRKPGWAREICTWERYERAVARAGADVGVGKDGYSGYLTRKASPEVRRAYYDALMDVLEAGMSASRRHGAGNGRYGSGNAMRGRGWPRDKVRMRVVRVRRAGRWQLLLQHGRLHRTLKTESSTGRYRDFMTRCTAPVVDKEGMLQTSVLTWESIWRRMSVVAWCRAAVERWAMQMTVGCVLLLRDGWLAGRHCGE